jgi:phosphoglucomutase
VHDAIQQGDSVKMRTRTISCAPFSDQKMGTAGLRKKVVVFQQPHYLACFIQAVLDTLKLPAGATLVLGGDGRYFNREAIPIIASVLAGNGVGKIIVGANGLMSTPAASNLIRKRRANGGFLLTASHNPGGPDGDFGIKFNLANGGQAPPGVTDAVYETSRRLKGYCIAEIGTLPLDSIGETTHGSLVVEVVDPVRDYEALMQSLFDFDRIRRWIRAGNRFVFDGLHGVTGPYAERILGQTLGCPRGDLFHAEPLADFGGLHPDPNPVDARQLVALAARQDSPALLAASDGDGDRNMILGPGMLVSPGDSVAVMLASAKMVPGYRDGFNGVARSMPTSRALDVVAASQSLPCYETPTGWRYFCNLLEAGRIGLCGEESFGTGSSHVREKDGLWAVLFWLNLLAARDESIPAIMRRHWDKFGRHYYQRHDYEVAEAQRADAVVESLRARLSTLSGTTIAGGHVVLADDFSYRDPVDGSLSERQGIRIVIDNGLRMIFRLSGTGTAGATLRIYLERYEPASGQLDLDSGNAVAPIAKTAAALAQIEQHTGLKRPSAKV